MDSNKEIVPSNSFVTFNCKSVKRSVEGIRQLCKTADLIALQETWLLPHDLPYLASIDAVFGSTGTSAVDTTAGMLVGRPYGGVALLWRKSVFPCVAIIPCSSARICAIKIDLNNQKFIVCSVYMPVDCSENLSDFTNCLGHLSAIVEEGECEAVFLLGDYNAHPGQPFFNELKMFCSEQNWICDDVSKLDSNSFTYVSDVHGTGRWLDHCIVTESAHKLITSTRILYDVYWSDHFPLLIECRLNCVVPKVSPKNTFCNEVKWGNRTDEQINHYTELCNRNLKLVDFPSDFIKCSYGYCNDVCHRNVIDNLYKNIVSILSSAAIDTNKRNVCKQKKPAIIGWNKHVSAAHREARSKFEMWVLYGRPKQGFVYDEMVDSRRVFKSRLKWCQNHNYQLKMNILAIHHSKNDFGNFWKSTKRLNTGPGLPETVGGVSDVKQIANIFREQFTISSPLGPSSVLTPSAETKRAPNVVISGMTIARILKAMSTGKSPGHDGISIEHLKYAGVHLPRVLALLFNVCIAHSYLPEDLMRTTVVPIVKNRTGDLSDRSNYRPISLATTIAKIFDSVLNSVLEEHCTLHHGQHGFTRGLSTETAMLSLKHTVKYYTDRRTPVYACFLDLSKAFDMVSYDILWRKLKDAGLPDGYTDLLKFWYCNQVSYVRWANEYSEPYRMECGVRQGGLASPKLFNLYVDALVRELSGMRVGCHIGNVCVNNISYADDMVLLAPSVSALRALLGVCESFAASHGLLYNTKKSQFMVFKAGNKCPNIVPPISLYKEPLERVYKFKYLGHIVTDGLRDDDDIDRERRALSVRANMLAHRFSSCTDTVKITLFKAYCTSFYACSLWTNYTKKAYSALRVQYNNALRALLRLPRFCSASTMFAWAGIDSFEAIMRKKSASILYRVRGSSHSVLREMADSGDCPLIGHLLRRTRSLLEIKY